MLTLRKDMLKNKKDLKTIKIVFLFLSENFSNGPRTIIISLKMK